MKIISQKMLIGIVVLAIAVGAVTCVILMNTKKDNQKQEEKQKDTILLKEDLKFEINSEVTLLSIVSENNKVKILSEDEVIDTATLGEKELTIKYEVEEQEKEENFKITIVDREAPTIEFTKELSTTVGTKINLLKNVKVTDNSKEDIKATVEGDYNFDNEGTYNLKYVAEDSSNNKTEEEFTLKVNKKSTKSSSSNSTKPQTTSNKNTSTNNNNSNSGSVSAEEISAELDRLDAIRKSKSVLYTYDPTNEINALTKAEYRKYIEPSIYKRVFYYTCQKVDATTTSYVTKCDGGGKGCNQVAVSKFSELHPKSECDVNVGTSPKYTYYVHSGYTALY